METVRDFILLGSNIIGDSDCSHEIKKTLTPQKKGPDKARQHIKKQVLYFADKGLYCQNYIYFFIIHVWI